MDPCLYKRCDAIIILFVDDLRVAATESVLMTIYDALYLKFQITTSDCTRFLGMDTTYNIDKWYLKLHMETYIVSIYERFHSFDLSKGVPFREIVGCLMWICLCIMGPELLRVKDLARLSNCYTKDDFQSALKVLDRVYARRTHGIVIVRGGAGSEIIPSSTRVWAQDFDFGFGSFSSHDISLLNFGRTYLRCKFLSDGECRNSGFDDVFMYDVGCSDRYRCSMHTVLIVIVFILL